LAELGEGTKAAAIELIGFAEQSGYQKHQRNDD